MRPDPTSSSMTTDLSRLAKLKPDILKTYVRLPNDMEQTAIQAGHDLGIPSFSHYFWPALALGQDGTSHWATQRLGYQIAVSKTRRLRGHDPAVRPLGHVDQHHAVRGRDGLPSQHQWAADHY